MFDTDPQASCPYPGVMISVTRFDGALSLVVAGDIDASTGGRLTSVLERFMAQPGLVVDLGAVAFIDSRGAAAFAAAAKHFGKSMRINNASRALRTVFRIVGLDQIIDLDPPQPVSGDGQAVCAT